jgi:hypothetical protein
MTTPELTHARAIVRLLSFQEKLYLLNDITAQLVQEAASSSLAARPSFPVFHVAEWPADIPMRREDLYDDCGR